MHSNHSALHLVITKPVAGAQLMHSRLQELNLPLNVFIFPTIRIKERLLSPTEQQRLHQINECDGLIFTSVPAVEKFFAKINCAIAKSVELFAVGPETAAALARHLPREVIVPPTYNSEGLLATAALSHCRHKRFLLLKGEGGRALLQPSLQRRGALVNEIALYQRVMPHYRPEELAFWHQNRIDLVVTTSNNGLQNLVSVLGSSCCDALGNSTLLVVSQRMAEFAEKYLPFKPNLLLAEGATTEQIIKAIKSYVLKKD